MTKIEIKVISETKTCKYCGRNVMKNHGHHCSGKEAYAYGFNAAECLKVNGEINGQKPIA